MRLPKRFTLSTLLLLMLIVASVFGYSQWRRQWLRAEVREMNATSDPILKNISGVRPVELYDDWFWPTVSKQAGVVVRTKGQGLFVGRSGDLTASEAIDYLRSKAARLQGMGVKDIVYAKLILGEPTQSGRPSITVVILDSPENLRVD